MITPTGDAQYVGFLQRALPMMGLRWSGFRKVRGQVIKRIRKRIHDLGLSDLQSYEQFLAENQDEWPWLTFLCRVTISRFYRDREVFTRLAGDVLPELADRARDRSTGTLRCWSVGSASGEEAYTVSLIWELLAGIQYPEMSLEILAWDIDPNMISRAEKGCYEWSSIKDLPGAWRTKGFVKNEDRFCLQRNYKDNVTFFRRDIRSADPDGSFDLILCRNLVFTYFSESLQAMVLSQLEKSLVFGGALVIGKHEFLPGQSASIEPWITNCRIFRKTVLTIQS
ncbi:CheR family methyltransferase [Thermodesulfobacteriota bacterium]